MSYCRTTLFEYQTEEDANELFAKYQANAPTNFPDAEVLLCTRTGPKTAQSIGLNGDTALEMLASSEKADNVRQKEQFWTSRGVTGVPAMIFQRQHLVSGAQGEENYARILQHLAENEAA